ncbi:hypothetical protein [Zavarzinia sp. CC-PAN008]|uniref:hypothetical protein n=1 Tax=Zavarzinia sp. CC-PAN008 TaxID=3243332 RepID=UPI003F748A8C
MITPDHIALAGGLLWLVAWALAVGMALRLVRLRRPDLGLWDLAVGGYRFFRRDTFVAGAEADRAHRLFLLAVLGAAIALALLVTGAVMAGQF